MDVKSSRDGFPFIDRQDKGGIRKCYPVEKVSPGSRSSNRGAPVVGSALNFMSVTLMFSDCSPSFFTLSVAVTVVPGAVLRLMGSGEAVSRRSPAGEAGV